MSSERTSATSNDRFRQRQRSGVRSALIWGGVLLAALSIYLIAYALTRHFTHLAWAKAINAALKAQDTAQSAALLQACRREQPALSKKPQFVMWQNQLAVLQQNQAQKSAIFQHKLAQLRQLLEKPDAVNMQVWPLQLAETARYAATETELSQLRSIQLQCEALNRRQQLRHTQIAAELLQYINSQLKVLSRLRQQNNPAEHRNLSTKCNNILQELQQNYPAVPEIAQQALQLRKQLQHENSQLQQHEQQLQAENHAFRQILNSAFAAEAVTRAKDFLQRYPQSKYSAGVGNMLQSIQLLEQLQHDRSLSDRIAAMEQKNQQAIAFWRKEFARIMQTALQGTVFELVMNIPTEKNKIKRFETIEKVSFQPASGGRTWQIKFNSPEYGPATGVFQADGRGTVTAGSRNWNGQMLHPARPAGELPTAHWQELLYQLDLQLQTLEKTQFPHWLGKTTTAIRQNKLLPSALQQQLLTALQQTAEQLGMQPQQFIFEYQVLTQVKAFTPVFAGFLHIDSDGIRYYLLRNSSTAATAWLLNGSQPPPWPTVGVLKAGKLQIDSPQLLTGSRPVHVLAAPEQAVNWVQQLQNYRLQAAKQNLIMPELPGYLNNLK